MMKQFLIPSILFALVSCDNAHLRDSAQEKITLHRQLNVWCPFDHDDILRKSSDNVFVFTEEHGDASVYTLIITKPNTKENYNAMLYRLDSLNSLYNAISNESGPKIFFEGLAFRVNADKLNEIEKRLDELFVNTSAESYVEMLDGSSFLVTYKGTTKIINTGPMVAKWKEYSIFLQDSVIRPYEELKKKCGAKPN